MAFADEYNRLLTTGDRPVKYSTHDDFLRAISKSKDTTPRSVYADWIEENEPHTATPETLALLRGSEPVWVSRGPDGVVRAGKKWTMAEIRKANASAGGYWFSPGTMRFFGTRVHGQPVSGPGGVYFVTSDDNYDRTGRFFSLRQFHPDTVTKAVSSHGDLGRFNTQAEAVALAHEMASRHPQPTE